MARAGKYDRLITIQAKSTTVEAVYGTDVITWSALDDPIWAFVEQMMPSRDEMLETKGGVELARLRSKVRIRYHNDVSSDMRVVFHDESDVIYTIVSPPIMIGRREELEFICERYTS